MEENKYLLTIEMDCADEFDVCGWCILTETDLNRWKRIKKAVLSNLEIEQEFYFGTNECVPVEKAFDKIKIQKLDVGDADIFEKYNIPQGQLTTLLDPDALNDYFSDYFDEEMDEFISEEER